MYPSSSSSNPSPTTKNNKTQVENVLTNNNNQNINHINQLLLLSIQSSPIMKKFQHHMILSLFINQLLPTNTIIIDLNTTSFIKLKYNSYNSKQQIKSNTTTIITILRKNKIHLHHDQLDIHFDITTNNIQITNKNNNNILSNNNYNQVITQVEKILEKLEKKSENKENKRTRDDNKNHHTTQVFSGTNITQDLTPIKLKLPYKLYNNHYEKMGSNKKITPSRDINADGFRLVSHNPNSCAAVENGTSRLELYKKLLLSTYNTAEQIDCLMLQESNIVDPNHSKYDVDDFNNRYTTFYTSVRRKGDHLGPKRHGQITLMNKKFNAKKLKDYSNNNLLTVCYQNNNVNNYILNVYITHGDKKIDMDNLIQITNSIYKNDKTANIFVMGDYNTQLNKMRNEVLPKINIPSHNLLFFNNNDKHTHIKPINNKKIIQTTIDHTIAAINDPTVKYNYTVLDSIIPTMKQLHHKPIQLYIYNNINDENNNNNNNSNNNNVNKKSSSRPTTSNWPAYPGDKSNTYLLFDKYATIVNSLSKHQFKRKILDNAKNIQTNRKWMNILQIIDSFEKTLLSSRSIKSLKQKQLDQLFYSFIETNFMIIGEELNMKNGITKNMISSDHVNTQPRHNWCTMRYYSMFNYWVKIDKIYSKNQFNFTNLNNNETKSIINLIPNILHNEYNTFWGEDEERYINKLIEMHEMLCENGNIYEAEKQIKKIVKYHTFHAVRAKTKVNVEKQVVINPTNGKLCTESADIANAFAEQYKTMDQTKAASSQLFYSSSSSTVISSSFNPQNNMNNATSSTGMNDNASINTEKNNDRNNNKGLSPNEMSTIMNKEVSASELSRAIVGLKAFTSNGADNIPIALYKAALKTSGHNKTPLQNDLEVKGHALNRQGHFLSGRKCKVYKLKNKYVKRLKTWADDEDFENNYLLQVLLKMFNIVLKTGLVPSTWKLSHILPLHKTGDAQDTLNYRPISLISNGQKIFNKILANRILHINSEQSNTTNPVFNKNQAGYTPKRERYEQIMTILEYANTYNIDENHPVYVLFIDLKKAFDSCTHSKLIEIFNKKFGTLDTPVHHYLLNMYNNIYFTIKNNNSFSQIIKQLIGIKQGCTISPLMFNLYFNEVLDAIAPKKGDNHISPAYADDLALATLSLDDMARLDSKMCKAFEYLQLDINVKKTVMLIINKHKKDLNSIEKLKNIKVIKFKKNEDTANGLSSSIRSATCTLDYNGSSKEYNIVSKFKYLGLEIPHNMDFNFFLNNIDLKKQLAINKHVLYNGNIPTDTKLQIINKHIIPRILHNAPLFGMLMINEDQQKLFEVTIDSVLAQTINTIQRIPRCKSTTNFIIFNNNNIVPPSVSCKVQALRVCAGLIKNSDKINSWMSHHINNIINPYLLSSEASGRNIKFLKNKEDLNYDDDIKNKVITNTPFYSTLWYWLPKFKNCGMPTLDVTPVQNNQQNNNNNNAIVQTFNGNDFNNNFFNNTVCIDQSKNVAYKLSTEWLDCTPLLPAAVKRWQKKAKAEVFQQRTSIKDMKIQYPIVKNLQEIATITNSPLALKAHYDNISKEKELLCMAKIILMNEKMISDMVNQRVTTYRYVSKNSISTRRSYVYAKKISPHCVRDGWRMYDSIRAEHIGEYYYTKYSVEPVDNACPMCNATGFSGEHLFICAKNGNLKNIAKIQYLDYIHKIGGITLINDHIYAKSGLSRIILKLQNDIIKNNKRKGEVSEEVKNWCLGITKRESIVKSKLSTRGYTIPTYLKKKQWMGGAAAEEYRVNMVNSTENPNHLFFLDPDAISLYEAVLLSDQLAHLNADLISGMDFPILQPHVNHNAHFLVQVLQTLFVAIFFQQICLAYPHLVKF